MVFTEYNADMPGKRASNKRQFTAAFPVDELRAIDEAARSAGITRTDFLRRAASLLLAKMKESGEAEAYRPEASCRVEG